MENSRIVTNQENMSSCTQYLQNPEKTAAPKEILQASKPSGHVAYVCKVDLADIILSAETAALEDGLINALQHHSIRSILGTATNMYCFGVEAPCSHCAPLRALNEQVSWFLIAFCCAACMSCPMYLPCSVWFAHSSAGWSTVARVNFLNGGVLKLDVTRAM